MKVHSIQRADVDAVSRFDMDGYLSGVRELALAEIARYTPTDRRYTGGLYELMMDYPTRPAKALRPSLCIGVCLALGGHLDAALPSAAALELLHNAFLIHDDVEDNSLLRRHGPTLHSAHGVPIAVNVADAMFAIALDPLLQNIAVLGLGPALRILELFKRMMRESVEGQMLELDWIRRRRWDLEDRDYIRMVHKKTGWYSFIAPVQAGAIAAGAQRETIDALGRFALTLGLAFQIKDDLLSLEGDTETVGKDSLGDLWEGKYTLPLLHTLRVVSPAERAELLSLLDRPRSRSHDSARDRRNGREAVIRLHDAVTGRDGASIERARGIAEMWANRAMNILRQTLREIRDSIHRRFLCDLVDFVTGRAY